MLTKELFTGSFRKGIVKPSYLLDTALAKKIILLFKKNEGNKYKLLKQEIKSLEEGRQDFKTIRGLAELVKRRCEFSSDTSLDSNKVRTFLFEHGFVINQEEREKIIRKATNYFEVPKEKVESAFFADMPEEQVYNIPLPPIPQELIRSYNFSLIQTLLFNAIEFRFNVSSNFQNVFRMINYLGLMYETDGMNVKVIGPLSFLKMTRKYGTSMAKLLPFILKAEEWELEGKIKIERGGKPKIFTFKLNSKNDVLLPDFPERVEGEEFDSEVEEKFYNDFKIFAPDWKIIREPKFIKAGTHVIIPDFGFFKNDISIYLEIAGFWTPEYIERKIEKFKKAEEEILVALNKDLKCSRDDFPGDVIMYDKFVPIKPILEILKKKEEEIIKKTLSRLDSITISEDIVDINKKSREINILPEVFNHLDLPDHYIIGEKIVSKNFLLRMREEIGNKREFVEIKPILEKYQLTDKALELMGFKIIWQGLLPIRIQEK